MLNTNKPLKTKEFCFFYDYVVLLDRFSVVNFKEKIISETFNKNPNEIVENLDFNEVFSDFIIKKIHFSIVNKSFKELEKIVKDKEELLKTSSANSLESDAVNADSEIESFFENFFESLISYMKKSFENIKEFLNFCYATKINNEAFLAETPENEQVVNEKEYNQIINHYCVYALEKINFYLINALTEEKNIIHFINKSNLIAFGFLKRFIEFERNFKKLNLTKNYKLKYSISDIFITNEKCFQKLQELIIIQKNFCNNFFLANIANIVSDSFAKENRNNLFIENTLYEKLKIIIKDNFLFLNAFESSPEIFSITYEENYKYFIKELLNFLRNIYNKQVSYFSGARKINKLSILYLIDFCIKFLCLKSKLMQKVTKINWIEENKNKFYDFSNESNETKRFSNTNLLANNSILLLNNKISRIINENYIEEKNINNNLFFEGLQILNNFITLLTKEFKEKSFSFLIEMFEYSNLISLDEEKIDSTCHDCNEDLKNLIYYIDSSNINKEFEYILYEIILTDILVHINNELDTSLKKNPKNKLFCHLADKVKNIMNLLISKFNKKEDLKKDENLKRLIKKFNSNINTLKLYAL